MPPVQNTFSIVPDAPSAINASRHGGGDSTAARPGRPPMTTKQVKKAYQKANKGPKLSKAEQRRQELFEQDRIRKEFEKEKNQARARAARDKKKEKEERERAEKKKKGLPLVHVRASQDTIARFVRAKPKSQREHSASPLPIVGGCKDEPRRPGASPRYDDSGGSSLVRKFDDTNKENVRPHDEYENASPLLHVVPIDNGHGLGGGSPMIDHAESLNKKRKIDVFEDEEEEREDHEDRFLIAMGVASPSRKPSRKVLITSDQMKETPCPNAEQSRLDLDDSFSTVDFSEEDLLDDLLRKTEGVHSAPNASSKRIPGQQQGRNPPTESPPPKPPKSENPVPSLKKAEESRCLEWAAGPTGPLSFPRQAVPPPEPTLHTMVKTPRRSLVPEQAKRVSTPHSVAIPPAPSAAKSQPIAPSSRSFRHPTTPMAPPPAPPKFRPSKQASASHPRPPQFLKPPLPSPRTPAGGSCRSRMTKPEQAQENKPPPSTQLFILNHLDDFFPSPSQEVREIFEEPRGKHTKNASKTQSTGTHTSHKASKPNPHISKVPTTSYDRSVIPTSAVNPGGSRHIGQIADYPEPRGATPLPSIQPIPQNTETTFDMPFFSTQDVLLSSQDVKDIEEDPLPPSKAQAPTAIPPKDCIKPPDPPRRSPKPFFTSSCREMRYKYVIERNRTAAWEGPSARQQAREELDRFQALEDEWLDVLLANPMEEGEKEQKGVAAVGSCATKPETAREKSSNTPLHGTHTPQGQPSRLTSLDSTDRSSRSPMASSGSIPEGAMLHRTHKSPDAQRSRPGSSNSSGVSRRATRPKGSYEAMLELLAKGPAQQKQRSSAANKHRGDGAEHTEKKNQTTTNESYAITTTLPASQETDYDCGEEWDDDDLLCDML
ncbi:hypothetical protein F4824DRAFT_381419 [Ustulina deusta]|nr:hypothetical protein F4824DRAFT_381419 [Ustulina deusta]